MIQYFNTGRKELGKNIKTGITELAVLASEDFWLLSSSICFVFLAWNAEGQWEWKGERGRWADGMSRIRLIRKYVRRVTGWSQQSVIRKEHLKGSETPASRNGWQFPVRMERMSFFAAENALLITVHQIIFLWKFPILPDSYFKFVLGRNCHAAGSWHFWQALIIHIFYLEAKSVRSFQSGSYSWVDGGAEPGAHSQPSACKPHTMAIFSP